MIDLSEIVLLRSEILDDDSEHVLVVTSQFGHCLLQDDVPHGLIFGDNCEESFICI